MPPLTDAELDHLLNFIGYGNPDAKVWFLGMEEGGGGEDNIRARLQFRQIEDCREGHRILGINEHHEGRRKIQRTWRGMCYIMLQLEGKEPNRENIRAYQATELGCFGSPTLLSELMPLPKPNIDAWGYEEFIPRYPNREEYYQTVKPWRIEYLRQQILGHRPRIVIGYGKDYWPDYQEIFRGANFQEEGSFAIARSDECIMVLTHHFTAKTMNGNFDRVVELIRDYY